MYQPPICNKNTPLRSNWEVMVASPTAKFDDILSLYRNWLTTRASEHSPCNGQASAFQNAKGKFSNDKNPLSFLMTYFYNYNKVIQGLIPSHSLPPTHPWCLVTPVSLVLLIPQSSSKFELLLPNPKCTLLEDILSPDMSDCYRSKTRFDFS